MKNNVTPTRAGASPLTDIKRSAAKTVARIPPAVKPELDT